MKLDDFLEIMNKVAPLSLAWERDNPGLILGTDRKEIKKVFLALDCTVDTAREAVDWGADLMLTHHPLFWEPVRHILPDDPDTAAAFIMLRHGIALYAAHTNLDAAPGGVNDRLAELLELKDVEPLPPEMLGRIGCLSSPLQLSAFADKCGAVLNTEVRCGGEADSLVKRIAIIGGAGGGELRDVLLCGADTLLTGEIKHDQALWARQAGINVVAAGHYESESVILETLVKRLQGLTDDVQYSVTRSETSCLRRL